MSAATSSAEELVRRVAHRIGMSADQKNSQLIDIICDNMKTEFVIEEWQLSALDSFQWQTLGAPIGLAAAVRGLAKIVDSAAALADPLSASARHASDSLPSLVSKAPALAEASSAGGGDSRLSALPGTRISGAARSSLLSSLRQSAAPRSSAAAERQSSINLPQSSADRERMSSGRQQSFGLRSYVAPRSSVVETAILEGGEEAGDEQLQIPPADIEHQKAPEVPESASKTEGAPNSGRSLRAALRKYKAFRSNRPKNLFERIAGLRSFPTTVKFQRALIHSKTGADLKAHAVFVMELNVLAAALLLGASVELWGLFPLEHVKDWPDDPSTPFIPRNLALFYHFTNSASLIIQLICTVGWIWSLHATAAVSPTKFHLFRVQTRFAFDRLLLLTETGQMLFALNTTILLGAMVAATTIHPMVRKAGYALPIVLLLVGMVVAQTISSYVGRAAYHGLLLTDNDPETAISNVGCKKRQKNKDTAAAAFEKEIAECFRLHNVVCEDSVLDAYHEANTHQAEDLAGYSLLDIIFPDSQPHVGFSKSNTMDALDGSEAAKLPGSATGHKMMPHNALNGT